MKSWKIVTTSLFLSAGMLMAAPLQVYGAGHGEYESAETRIQDMTLMAERDGLRLYLDEGNGEFAVENGQNGAVWFSNPYDSVTDAKSGDDAKTLLQSYLRLSYYDQQAKQSELSSWKDCMAKDQFTVEPLDGGFRLNLQIGEVAGSALLPAAAEAENFEEKVIAKLEGSSLRKINSYYTRVSLSDTSLTDAVREAYRETYPGLEEHDFYILRPVVDREKKDIDSILKTTDYTQEDMAADAELSGYEGEEGSSILIEMALEVTIDNGSLLVKIPGDSIRYDDSSYILASITLLQYFGAGRSETGGYLMIPDGSGALIAYNTDGNKKGQTIQKPVYGTDYAMVNSYSFNALTEQAYFPVFGNKAGEQAFLGILEEGEAMATIYSETGNLLTGYETVYPIYHYITSSTVNYSDGTKLSGAYTYHDTRPYSGDYAVRYCLLSGEDAGYVGMAKAYRAYLIGTGAIAEEASQSAEEAPVYVEVLGTVEKEETFLGIPYQTYAELTTFEQAERIIEELSDGGVGNLKLRYTGWANNGMNYEVSNHVDVMNCLGGSRKLQELWSYAGQQGAEVFPDVDFATVRKDKKFDGYSASRNSADSLQREDLYLVTPKELTTLNVLQYVFWSVSPAYWPDYMGKYFRDYDKLGLDSISIGSFGTMLYGDYNRKASMSREEVKDIVSGNVEKLTGDKKVMTEGANAYMLPYVTDIVNMPLSSSSYTAVDETIPFLQLVLHGSVGYSSPTLNLQDNIRDTFLKCIEYGASPYFTVAYDNAAELKNTVYDMYYSVDYRVWQQEILRYGSEFEEAYNGLGGLAMTNHEKLQDGVYRTTYEDGTSFLVNYNDIEVTADGKQIPANSYLKAAR